MRGRKLKRNILMVGLITTLCLMGIGYAAFQTSLTIKGTGTIQSTWDVRITGISDGVATGNADEKSKSFDALTANMEANLYAKGDAMEYDVTIENKGTVPATLNGIETNNVTTNEAVKINVTGYTKGEILETNASKIVHVKIEYDENYEGIAPEGSGTVAVTFNFTQAESAVPVSGGDTPVTVSKYKLSFDCSTNGLSSCSSNDEYYKEGTEVSLSTKTATDKKGYDFKGWGLTSDATSYITSYTMTDEDKTLYAIYEAKPGPSITNVAYTSTTDSIKMVVTASDSEGEILLYEYSKDGGDTWTSSTSNTYTFEGLKQNTEYTMYVRVVNEIGGTGYSDKKKVSTNSISVPTFTTAMSGTNEQVTIKFNNDCNSFICSYSKNGLDFIEVSDDTVLLYVETGTIIAKVTDNVNTVVSNTYTVKVALPVTYDYATNGGTSSTKTSDRVYEGSTIDLSPTATKEGYTFAGWNTSSSATSGLENLTMGYDPVTLFAIFVDDISPTVNLNPNKQSSYSSGGTAVTVTLTDAGSGLAANQNVYYAWSTSNSTAPMFSNYVTTTNSSGSNSTTVTVPASASSNLSGTYYLWIKSGILDSDGNESLVKTSGAFNFDNANPTVNLSTTTTTNTLTITAAASAASGISDYEFTIGESPAICADNTDDNICVIEGLTHNTEYDVSVTVTSGVNKTATESTSATTKIINSPTYSLSKNVVTITYPSVTLDEDTVLTCLDGLTCAYKKDDGTPVTIDKDTSGLIDNKDGTYSIEVTFTAKGDLLATISDGTNTIPDSSETYKFAPAAENLSYDNSKTKLACTGDNANAQCALDKIKEMLD